MLMLYDKFLLHVYIKFKSQPQNTRDLTNLGSVEKEKPQKRIK